MSRDGFKFIQPGRPPHLHPAVQVPLVQFPPDHGQGLKRERMDSGDEAVLSSEEEMTEYAENRPRRGKKTKGRVKIKMEFIDDKLRRYTTFSKRKTGIMKKAYELSTLTGTQVMLLVASETGHVYTFATKKLQPMITSEAGKALIQTCLNNPEIGEQEGDRQRQDIRMSAMGYEEPDLSYHVPGADQEEAEGEGEASEIEDRDTGTGDLEDTPSPSPSSPPVMPIPPVVLAQLLNTGKTKVSEQIPSSSSFQPISSKITAPISSGENSSLHARTAVSHPESSFSSVSSMPIKPKMIPPKISLLPPSSHIPVVPTPTLSHTNLGFGPRLGTNGPNSLKQLPKLIKKPVLPAVPSDQKPDQRLSLVPQHKLTMAPDSFFKPIKDSEEGCESGSAERVGETERRTSPKIAFPACSEAQASHLLAQAMMRASQAIPLRPFSSVSNK